MKKSVSILLISLISPLFSYAQENPFNGLGYDVLVATSSKGDYAEFHNNKDIVEIGSVYFNMKTNQVVGFIDENAEDSKEVISSTNAMSIDPHCEKYYWISPYAYCMNNPVKYIDPDGRDIVLFNVTHRNNSGRPDGTRGQVSSTTNAALKDLVGTKDGLVFFSQFAKAGDVVGGHTFAEDGKYSSTTLTLYDYSWEKETGNIILPASYGSLSISADNVILQISSYGQDKNSVGETLTHETQLHGYKTGDKIDGKATTTGTQDHNALKNKDSNHGGYKNYNSTRQQLEKTDPAYKDTFKEAEEHARRNY